MTDHANSIARVKIRDLRIFSALLAFIAGVLVASFLSVPPLLSILIIVASSVGYFIDREVLLFIILISFSIGLLRYEIKDFHELRSPGTQGIVVSEPEKRDTDTRFVVLTNTGEKVLVSTNLLSKVKYGDEVELAGKPNTATGSYAKFLSMNDIYYTINFAKVTVISEGHGNILTRTLLGLKSSFTDRIRKILPEPEASLLGGLIVSGKEALSQSILDDFRRAGVVHIVVLSGYNITVIAEFLLMLFAFAGRRWAATAALSGVMLFVIMSGAEATVLRGAIMIVLTIFGGFFGRQGSAPRILLFTAVVMLLLNPKILVFDASFQLSFLAMLGLIYGEPLFQKAALRLVANVPMLVREQAITERLAELISTTIATQLFVFPFLLYNMGNFSTVFLLSNLLILPLIPITMLLGFVATLIAFIHPIISFPLAWVTHLLLKYILFVAHSLGSLSFASIQIASFPLWGTLLMYLLLLSVILWQRKNAVTSTASISLGHLQSHSSIGS